MLLIFQSTRPVWGATKDVPAWEPLIPISIHAPRVGRDDGQSHRNRDNIDFNPRAPCGARLPTCSAPPPLIAISIHAPRVGRDLAADTPVDARALISIHAPRVGRDRRAWRSDRQRPAFQSTRPVWGATNRGRRRRTSSGNFNPRAPCGARPLEPDSTVAQIRFQSTRPVWGATGWENNPFSNLAISIHAPRVGRDDLPRFLRASNREFQSTRPVWGATTSFATPLRWSHFNPRAPCGARPNQHSGSRQLRPNFNPRAPCGARPLSFPFLSFGRYFNPRAPCGARPYTKVALRRQIKISIHAPRVGRDHEIPDFIYADTLISIHAPRVGRDPRHRAAGLSSSHFNPRAPCGARPSKLSQVSDL